MKATTEQLECIRTHTLPFIAILHGITIEEAKDYKLTWQVFSDSDEAKQNRMLHPETFYGSIKDNLSRFLQLNDLGQGIYVTINESLCDKRTHNDIKQIVSVWTDLDDKEVEEPNQPLDTSQISGLTPRPSIVVSTGHGIHLYYVLDRPVPVSEGKKALSVLWGINSHFKKWGADPKVCDIARVLRVPGFINMKTSSKNKKGETLSYEPVQVKLVDTNEIRYTLDQLSSVFPYSGPIKTDRSVPVLDAQFTYQSSLSLDERLKLAEKWLEDQPPAIQGEDGSGTCMTAAWVGPRFALPIREALKLMMEVYNPTCEPEWSNVELAHKLKDVYKTAKEEGLIGCDLSDFNKQKDKEFAQFIEANQARFPVENADDENESESTDDPEDEAKQLDMRCALMSQDDMGFAKRLKLRYGNILQFHNKSWYYYNKRFWEVRQDAPIKLLDRVTQKIKSKEIFYTDDDDRKGFLKWAEDLGSAQKVEGATRLAKSLLNKNIPFEIPCSSIINFHNGTLELTTGKLRAHQSSDNFLYCLPYDYWHDAKSEAWDQYLHTVFMGNEELVRYVQNLIGCTLLSNTDNEFSVWLSGDGSNGKTTFTETISHALGQLAQQIPNDLFLTKKYGQNHPTEIARLHQVKFATCSDISLNSKLDEGTFKRLVSTGKATGRFMHRDYFDFTMTHKFWISVNNLPSVYDESYGLWRRMIVIPFNKKFSPQERDDTIKARLKEQIDGVWAWMVRGAMEFHRIGLMEPPQSVKEAVEQWKSTEDWWTNFLAEECIVADHKRVPSSILYDEFLKWAKKNSSPHISHVSFSKRVAQAGFEKYKSNGSIVFKGIGINYEFDDERNSRGL